MTRTSTMLKHNFVPGGKVAGFHKSKGEFSPAIIEAIFWGMIKLTDDAVQYRIIAPNGAAALNNKAKFAHLVLWNSYHEDVYRQQEEWDAKTRSAS